MAVRIARVDLHGVQAIVTDEGRRWVEQHIPGRAGSLFQELGRSAVRLQLEGLLWGEDALEALEALRTAQAEAEPVPFSADITAGMDFTDVLIDTLQVRQVAGYRDRYWYRLQVREHVEEPPEPEAALSEVDAAVEADAASWAEGSVDAATGIQDATALPELVEANPDLVDHLSTDDLAGALDSAAGGLTGGGLDGILSSVGLDSGALGAITDKLKNVQMSDVIAAYNAIQDPSSIPGLLASNPGLLDRLGVSDLGKALVDKADALTGGQFSQVLQTLGKVDPQKVVGLINDLRSAGSLGEFVEKLAAGGVDIVKDLTGVDLGDAAAIVQGVAGSAEFLSKLKKVGDKGGQLASKLRGFDPLSPVRALSGQDPGDVGQLSDIVTATGELITALSELLATSTVNAVIAIVKQVGAEAQLDSAVDFLAGVLDEVDRLLEGAREPLLQLGALSGLLQLTRSLVGGLEKITQASGEDLAALGLGDAMKATGPMAKALGTGQDVLAGGAAVLDMAPSVESLDSLRTGVANVRQKLLGYKSSAAQGGTA
ncbi:DNA circularization N-terminal domain-containing protein [Hyalangium gracile]|uniref:DNA circularization N-terminal domain-containing protein n=1 Tax=Hyalangium gracile TaxID=394092 RepID=UPI001CC98BC1|nr:DNA circularization N-terminal domain-containing protein [Hyalangium gracile]